jgi:Variant SH3 domain
MEPRKPIGPMHDFARESAEYPRPKIRSRASSKAGLGSRPHSPGSADSEVDEPRQPRSRRGSVHSRAGSTRSRKRSDSQTTTGSVVDAAREKKEKEEKKKGGWSVWSRSGTKKDREQFAALRDNADDSDNSDPEGTPGSSAQVSKNSSLLSLGKWSKSQQSIASPRIPALGSRARGGELERQKVVRAVNDYLGSTDELSFRTGDEIVVIGEVIDGWMMGQLGDKKGLFPTIYTEPITTSSRRTVSTAPAPAVPAPPLLRRKSSTRTNSDVKTDSPSDSRQTLVDTDSSPSARLGSRTERVRGADTEDDDDVSHPFGDHHATTHDTDHARRESASSLSGTYGYSYDSESLAESAADESEHEHSSLVRRHASDDDGFVNPRSNDDNNNGNNTSTSTITSTSSGPPKKVPPPLPRRQADVRKAPPPPPPPPRRPDVRASPQPPTYGLRDGQTGDCVSFVQAAGRATGMCANCQRMHIE